MSIIDTHRKLGIGEKAGWGDCYETGRHIDDSWINHVVTEDDTVSFYRPLIREAAPHVFDERNAPKIMVLEEAKTPAEPERAKTDDGRKPPLAHLPWAALREMAYVQQYGHQKYGDFYNYRKGMEVGRNLSCAIRHIAAYMEGEDLDPESQCSHLGHAMCRLGFVLQNLQDGTAIDDRWRGGAK